MTRAGQAQARAKTEAALPTRLTLQWLLAEMVTAGLIPPEAPGKLKFPPAKKGDSGNPHPLVVAAFVGEVMALTPDPRQDDPEPPPPSPAII